MDLKDCVESIEKKRALSKILGDVDEVDSDGGFVGIAVGPKRLVDDFGGTGDFGEDDDAPLDAVSASVGVELVEVGGAKAEGVGSGVDVQALPLDIDDDVAVWGFDEDVGLEA